MQQGSPKVTALRSLRPGQATQSDKEDKKRGKGGEGWKRRGRERRHNEKEKRQEGRALWGNVRYLSVSIEIRLHSRVALMSKGKLRVGMVIQDETGRSSLV